MAKRKHEAGSAGAKSYQHPESKSLMRPDIGTQAQFTNRAALPGARDGTVRCVMRVAECKRGSLTFGLNEELSP